MSLFSIERPLFDTFDLNQLVSKENIKNDGL